MRSRKQILNRTVQWGVPAVAVMAIVGCATNQVAAPDGGNPIDTTPVAVTLSLESNVNGAPLQLLQRYMTPNGVDYEVTKFRYYLSSPLLVDTSGVEHPVQLLDTSGLPLRYNLMLYDFEIPQSHAIRFKARPGNYRGLRFTVGVPLLGPTGDTLNHSDASVHEYPLNVDADMYWGWKPGYIHFKIEGRGRVDTADAPFYYHVGEDRRLMYLLLSTPFVLAPATDHRGAIRFDINKLFVTPSGVFAPNPGGSLADRVANSGPIADTVANNVARSGVFTFDP